MCESVAVPMSKSSFSLVYAQIEAARNCQYLNHVVSMAALIKSWA